jgi:hypothetical protein
MTHRSACNSSINSKTSIIRITWSTCNTVYSVASRALIYPSHIDRRARSRFPARNISALIASLCTRQPRSQGFHMRTRRDTRKPWSGPVTCYPKNAVFDSYSSRSGEIFFKRTRETHRLTIIDLFDFYESNHSRETHRLTINDLMKYTTNTSLRNKLVDSQKTSQSILFMCRATFGTNQLKSLKTPSMFSKIYRHISEDFQPQAKLHPTTASRSSIRLHASGDSHEICFLSSWTVWLLLLILSLNMLL